MPRVTIPTVGKYGIIADQPPHELPLNAWSSGKNMRFREQGAERFKGQRRLFDVSPTLPHWLAQYNQGGKRWWVHAGNNAIYADDGIAPRLTITPTSAPTGGRDDRWTGGTLSGVLVANNGKDVPIYWGGTGVMQPLTAWPATVRVASLRPYKNVLVGVDVTKGSTRYPHMIKWSSEAVPGGLPATYDETDVTKNAGEVEIASEPSLIVDQLQLGDANIIYKELSAWAMVPSGDSFIFRLQRIPGAVGALGRGCIADTPLGHVVLSLGDVVLQTGQGSKSIINASLRRWLFNQIDAISRQRSFVTTNPSANEAWICFPALGAANCTLAAVWNWADNTWAIRELQDATYGATGQVDSTVTDSWDQDAEPWDDDVTAWNQNEISPAQSRLMMAGADGAITFVDETSKFNGQPFVSQVERIGLAFDAPDQVKMVRAIYPRIDAAVGTRVRIEVGATMDVEKAVVWSAPVEYTVGQTFKADAFATGRFIGVRFTSMDNQWFRIRSYDLDIVTRGGY